MINEKVIFRQISTDEFKINEYELSARIGLCSSCMEDRLMENIPDLMERVSPKFCAVRCDVEYVSDGTLRIGGIEIKSRDIIKNLGGAREAYLFAATLGAEVDRFLIRLGMLSGADRFIVDGYASALVESLCDFAAGAVGTIGVGAICLPGAAVFLCRDRAALIQGPAIAADKYFVFHLISSLRRSRRRPARCRHR